jgi:hypothetical protein
MMVEGLRQQWAPLPPKGPEGERRAPRHPRWYQSRFVYRLALVLAAPVAVAALKTWQPVTQRDLTDALRVERQRTDSLYRGLFETLRSANALGCELARTTNPKLYDTVIRTNPSVRCP